VRPLITETVSAPKLATYTVLVSGFTATDTGARPTGNVAARVFMRPSTTEMVSESVVTYTRSVNGSTVTPKGRSPTATVRVKRFVRPLITDSVPSASLAT